MVGFGLYDISAELQRKKKSFSKEIQPRWRFPFLYGTAEVQSSGAGFDKWQG